MKVCFWGTYRRDYSRNCILRKGLAANGVAVTECHQPFLEDTKDKNDTIFKGGNVAKGIFELAVKYHKLITKAPLLRESDFIFVGYIGHYDMFLAKVLSAIMRKKIIFDSFISMYDSIVEDRGLIKKESFLSDVLRWLDRSACRLADITLYDTACHREYFRKELKISPDKSHVLYLGADDSIYYPRENRRKDGEFRVLFYGYFVPLQGIDYIIDAADMLKGEGGIRFKIIGRGQEMPRIKRAIQYKKLHNIEFEDRILPEGKLAEEIALSDACLGVFGKSGKTGRVIPNKVFQCLAMKKPVITGDTEAVRELFRDGKDLLLCETANARAIADAILKLKNNDELKTTLSEVGYRKFMENYTPGIIGKKLKDCIEQDLAYAGVKC